jgi:NitT/TauT family transport system substrate-binding protein/putative hydroxymethylpyrimidine transport system substrate-binding protein
VRALACLLLTALVLGGCGGEDEESTGTEPERAVLALDFSPNAVHAGVYEAVEGGHDRRNGVTIDVRVPTSSSDPLRLLATRRADLAILDIHDLGLARQRGSDLVGVGAIVQRPLSSVIARESVSRPRELEGRRAGVTGLPSDEAVLRAVVESDGGDVGEVRRITIGFSAVPSLISGRVDAATAFWNAEGVTLRERGVETREFRVDEFGAPRYPELVLVVRRELLERRRELVEDVVLALAEGTEAALEDPDGAMVRIARASRTDQSLVEAQFEAVREALSPPLVLDRAALTAWAEFDERFGILRERPDVAEAFDFELARP